MSIYVFQTIAPETVGFNFPEVPNVPGTVGGDISTGLSTMLGGFVPAQFGGDVSGCLFFYDPTIPQQFSFIVGSQIGFNFPEIPETPGTVNGDVSIGLTTLVGGAVLPQIDGAINTCLFPITIPIYNKPPGFGGGKTPKKCGNWYDDCLHDTADYYRAIDWKSVGDRLPECHENPNGECDIPADGSEINVIGGITLPPNDGLDYLVLSYQIPVGYRGVINSYFQLFTGSGFSEASGLLTWRLKIGQWWVKDMAQMTTSVGSLQTPYYMAGYVMANSFQTVQYYVNVAPAAGGVLSPSGKIIAGLGGYSFPLNSMRKHLTFDQEYLRRYWSNKRQQDKR